MCIDNNAVINNNYGRLQDLILLQHMFSKMFVRPGLVTVTTPSCTISCLMVQSSVNGVAHTSHKCDISNNFNHHLENTERLGLGTCSFKTWGVLGLSIFI